MKLNELGLDSLRKTLIIIKSHPEHCKSESDYKFMVEHLEKVILNEGTDGMEHDSESFLKMSKLLYDFKEGK